MKLFTDGRQARIALAGSGYISTGLLNVLSWFEDVTVTAILTSRDPGSIYEHPRSELLVREVDALIEGCDLIVECSGGVTRAMQVVDAALAAGLPVVTVNAEFQVTVGHLYTSRGLLTEAEGDQPGALAIMAEELTGMGFRPLVFGNVKSFLDPNPSVENMRHQAALHGISRQQVTSFTDGTKLHVEIALVANGLGAGLASGGVLGPKGGDLADCADALTERAFEAGPISDYCMPLHTDAHVFITAVHDYPVAEQLAHYKLGNGPVYRFVRDRHLGHFEVPRTIKRVLETGRPLINNGTEPNITVGAVAKGPIPAGTSVISGIGSTLVRGVAVSAADYSHVLPIGLLEGCTVVRDVAEGQFLSAEDVRLAQILQAQLDGRSITGVIR